MKSIVETYNDHILYLEQLYSEIKNDLKKNPWDLNWLLNYINKGSWAFMDGEVFERYRKTLFEKKFRPMIRTFIEDTFKLTRTLYSRILTRKNEGYDQMTNYHLCLFEEVNDYVNTQSIILNPSFNHPLNPNVTESDLNSFYNWKLFEKCLNALRTVKIEPYRGQRQKFMAYSTLFGEDKDDELTEEEKDTESENRKFYNKIKDDALKLCGSLNQLRGFMDGTNIPSKNMKKYIYDFLEDEEAKEIKIRLLCDKTRGFRGLRAIAPKITIVRKELDKQEYEYEGCECAKEHQDQKKFN